MKIERINPAAIVKMPTYTQAVKVTDGTLVYTAGQVSWDTEGTIIGEGDFRAQATQVFTNMQHILHTVGADWSNIVKLTTYIVQYDYDTHRGVLREVMEQFFDVDQLPAHTLIGVYSLALKEMMIEVEAVIAIEE